MQDCLATRQILTHWHNCNSIDCPICKETRSLGEIRKCLRSTNESYFTEFIKSKLKINGALNEKGERSWELSDQLRNDLRHQFAIHVLIGGESSDIDHVQATCKKFEEDLYQNCSNIEEYFHFMADLTFTFQKQLYHNGGNGTFIKMTNNSGCFFVLFFLIFYCLEICSFNATQECAICLLDVIQLASSTRSLQCGHVFHKTCIEKWIQTRSNCPLCRSDIFRSSDILLVHDDIT